MASGLSKIHFVGSLPLSDARSNLSTVASSLSPSQLPRIPDGEPSPRNQWTWYLYTALPLHVLVPYSYAAAEAVQRGIIDDNPAKWFSSPPPVVPAGPPPGTPLTIESMGYDKSAIESYKIFSELRSEGKIGSTTKFQISLPSAMGIMVTHVQREYYDDVYPALEKELNRELKEIQKVIPAKDLAIQWDCALEMSYMEDAYNQRTHMWTRPFWFDRSKETKTELAGTLARLASFVNDDVDLGFHFCYGDFGHAHWLEPADTKLLVEIINEVAKEIKRPVNWVHLPVPKERDDEAYFEPLKGLRISKDTELYLGILRENDLEGSKKRAATARKVLGDREFGIASECGLSRVPEGAKDLASILDTAKAIMVN